MTEYLQRLMNAKMRKLVLFTVFPITAAPNISDPKYFVMLNDLKEFISFKKTEQN